MNIQIVEVKRNLADGGLEILYGVEVNGTVRVTASTQERARELADDLLCVITLVDIRTRSHD